jgi:predicted permease
MNWLSRLFRRSTLERDLDKELRFHIETAVDDLVRGGMPRAEAERVARVQLGGVEQVKEDARDARGTRWVEDWISDTRYALRAMLRAPAFSAAAILTLAIGIGANVSVWRIIDALVRRALPVETPETLHAVKRVGIEDDTYRISRPTLLEMRAALPDTMQLAGTSSIASTYVTIGEQPERALTQLVTGNYFTLLGVPAQIGRVLTAADDSVEGGNPVVVISDRHWERRYARDASVIGRSIRLNGAPVTIVGVTQAGFAGHTVGTPVDIFAPTTMQHVLRVRSNASSANSDTEKPWGAQEGIAWLTLITRAEPSAAAGVAARLDPAFRAWLQRVTDNSTTDSTERAFRLRERIALEPISRGFSFVRSQFGEPLRALMVSVSLILLIACANLAGLLLARGAARTHETAVRLSLGARPSRLVRQTLTESLTLAAIGGIVGLLMSQWMTATLLRLASAGTVPIPLDVSVSAPTLLFTLLVTFAAGALFGVAPALRMARTNLYESFRRGGRGVSGHRVPLGSALVVGQIALSLILVASAAVFVRTFQNLVNVDPGYDRERVVGARIDIRAAGYTHEQLPALYDRLVSAVSAVPGVHSVSLSMIGLGTGAQRTSGFRVPGRTLEPATQSAQENLVTPEFFVTTGITFVAGQGFTNASRPGSPKVAVLTERAAKRFFGSADSAVGKRMGYDEPDMEVVGVIRDVRPNWLRTEPPVMVFRALQQEPQEYASSLEARVTGSPEHALLAIRRAIGGVDPDLPIGEVATLDHVLERGLSRERLVARLAGGFGILALLLAAIGLYGVISYSVARRTNEMGVRLALGASPAGVSWVVIRESLRTIALGLAVGVVLWFPLLGLARQLVYGLSPHDPATLAFSTVLLLLVGIAAALLPAVRAARIDPIEAIRAD